MATTELVVTGDLVELPVRHVGDHPRCGEILEVVGDPERPHYRVRWEDGHESLFYPAGDTRIRHLERPPGHESERPAVALLTESLRAAEIAFELLTHKPTLRALDEAHELGLLPQEVAKTLVACDEQGRHIRAVVPASSRLDLSKLTDAVDAKRVTLVDEGQLVASYPQFELGAVPPFSGPGGDQTVLDAELLRAPYVILEAGVHDVSLRLRPADLVRIADAVVAEISES